MMMPMLHFLTFALGALACFGVRQILAWGPSPVVAAATVALAASFIPLPSRWNRRELHAIFYAGSFAGMGAPTLLSGPIAFAVVSLAGTVLFALSKRFLHGFGGRLGAVAFGASLVWIALRGFP
jgi:hypothetical protein